VLKNAFQNIFQNAFQNKHQILSENTTEGVKTAFKW